MNRSALWSFVLVAAISLQADADTLTIKLKNGAAVIGMNGTYTKTEDTYLREPYGTAAPGKYIALGVGYDNYSPGGRARALVRFDVSGLKPLFGTTTTVKRAVLNLYITGVSGAQLASSKTVEVYRVAAANSG